MPTDRDLFTEEQSMVTMSFGEHIEELRARLILALLGLLVGVVFTFLPPLNVGKWIMVQMQEPATEALKRFYAKQASERADVTVHFSLPTLDERVWRTTEPGTAPPRSRLRAIRRLADAGIAVGVGMAPILPGLSDRPEQLRAVVRAARAAGAKSIWASVLHLRPGTREHFLEALARDWPEELGRYEELYAGRAYLPSSVSRPVQETVREATRGAPLRHVPSPKRRPAPELPQLRLAV